MTDKAIEAALNAWVSAPKQPYNLLPAMRAAITAYEQALWQPIEEAQKDGPVLLFGRQSYPAEGCGVRYDGELVFSGYWDSIDEDWCSTGSSWTGPFFEPTHYRPLPPPPESAK